MATDCSVIALLDCVLKYGSNDWDKVSTLLNKTVDLFGPGKDAHASGVECQRKYDDLIKAYKKRENIRRCDRYNVLVQLRDEECINRAEYLKRKLNSLDHTFDRINTLIDDVDSGKIDSVFGEYCKNNNSSVESSAVDIVDSLMKDDESVLDAIIKGPEFTDEELDKLCRKLAVVKETKKVETEVKEQPGKRRSVRQRRCGNCHMLIDGTDIENKCSCSYMEYLLDNFNSNTCSGVMLPAKEKKYRSISDRTLNMSLQISSEKENGSSEAHSTSISSLEIVSKNIKGTINKGKTQSVVTTQMDNTTRPYFDDVETPMNSNEQIELRPHLPEYLTYIGCMFEHVHLISQRFNSYKK